MRYTCKKCKKIWYKHKIFPGTDLKSPYHTSDSNLGLKCGKCGSSEIIKQGKTN